VVRCGSTEGGEATVRRGRRGRERRATGSSPREGGRSNARRAPIRRRRKPLVIGRKAFQPISIS